MNAALHPDAWNPIPLAPAAPASLHREEINRVQPCTVDDMARSAGVSRRLMFLALKAHRGGCEELREAMLDGTVTANLGAVLVDLFPSHEDQRTMLAEFATLPKRQWPSFAKRVAALMGNDPEIPEKRPQFSQPIPPKLGAFAMRLPSQADGNCHAGEQP